MTLTWALILYQLFCITWIHPIPLIVDVVFKGGRGQKFHILLLYLGSGAAVMVTIQQGFSSVTKAFTTVNDHWLAIILSAVLIKKHLTYKV